MNFLTQKEQTLEYIIHFFLLILIYVDLWELPLMVENAIFLQLCLIFFYIYYDLFIISEKWSTLDLKNLVQLVKINLEEFKIMRSDDWREYINNEMGSYIKRFRYKTSIYSTIFIPFELGIEIWEQNFSQNDKIFICRS